MEPPRRPPQRPTEPNVDPPSTQEIHGRSLFIRASSEVFWAWGADTAAEWSFEPQTQLHPLADFAWTDRTRRICSAANTGVEPYYYPSDTLDIAISKDGQYVAAVGKFWSEKCGDTVGQIRFSGRASGIPLWTWTTEDTFQPEEFRSVAISADGDSVVAGGMLHPFYWKNARSIRGIHEPTWQGVDIVTGNLERRCLDISDDGNYVVYCGPREDYGVIYYWSDASEFWAHHPFARNTDKYQVQENYRIAISSLQARNSHVKSSEKNEKES